MTTALDEEITRSFINENPQWFTFLRRERLQTSEGGWTLGPPTPVERKLVETFDKPDGPGIGSSVNWAQRIFFDDDLIITTEAGRLKYSLSGNALGGRERIYVPHPNFLVHNGRIEYDVPSITRTGDANYWNGLGAIIRGKIDAYDYSGFAVDFGINDQLFPGVELWSLTLWKVRHGGHGVVAKEVIPLDTDLLALASLTLPAHVIISMEDDTYSVVAIGANGGRMEASGVDTEFLEGEAAIGIGPVINGNSTVTMTMDNFSMYSDQQRGRLVQSGRIGASGLRHTPDGRLNDTTATIVLPVGSNVLVGDLVNVEEAHVGGDPALVGQWEVMDISGRWAMSVEISKHAG